MKVIKICSLTAVALVSLGLVGMAAPASAHESNVTGIEINAVAEMQKLKPAKNCVKKPKRVPGTGGPAQLPPGKRWC